MSILMDSQALHHMDVHRARRHVDPGDEGRNGGDQELIPPAPEHGDRVGGIGEDLLHLSQRLPGLRVPGGEAKELLVVKSALVSNERVQVPAWLEIDIEKLQGSVLSLPTRDQIDMDINEQLIVELYSK